jgi:O-acetyl-ADP-ribose deacetylase (regulator of RNase III)
LLEPDLILINGVSLELKTGDITREAVDAIVNAANPGLLGGGGVDGAIHRAGGPSILAACQRIVTERGQLPTGQAVITTGGNLPARYIIHTVGPVWRGGNQGEPALLASAYTECLKLASERKLATISFPSISTGTYGYPVAAAARVALKAAGEFLKRSPGALKEVTFVLYDAGTRAVYRDALRELKPSLE